MHFFLRSPPTITAHYEAINQVGDRARSSRCVRPGAPAQTVAITPLLTKKCNTSIVYKCGASASAIIWSRSAIPLSMLFADSWRNGPPRIGLNYTLRVINEVVATKRGRLPSGISPNYSGGGDYGRRAIFIATESSGSVGGCTS